MNNSYNVNGSIYTGISELDTSKNKYLFISDGNNITFLRETPNGNYENNYGGKFYPIALEDYRWANIIAEDMILTRMSERLTEMYGLAKTEVTLDNMVSYISYAATELQKLGNIDFDIDPTLPMEEKEQAFIDRCNTIAMDIDNVVMAKMRSNGKDIVDNSYKDDGDITLQDIISHLSLYDLNNIAPIVKDSEDPLKATVEYLANRDDIKYLVEQGMSRREAIKFVIIEGNPVTLETGNELSTDLNKDKVKVLTPPNKNAAYVDMIILGIIAQITIFLVLLGVIFLIK